MKTIKIFVSSPSDVAPERIRVGRVIKAIEAEYPSGIKVEVIRWEEAYYSASSTFQDQISPPAEADIVICILWKRLGSALPESFNRKDGTSRTGTEYEFETALDAAFERQIPDILLYRKNTKILFNADRVEQEKAELQALESFWRRWVQNEKGHFTAGFKTFETPDDFEQIIKKDLTGWFKKRLHNVTWPADKGSPYRGLEVFEAEHYPIYFGRKRAIREVRARLIANVERENIGFLLVIGASGAGKSSLIRAGLVPTLKKYHPVPGIADWRELIIRPSELGEDWCLNLAQRMSEINILPHLLQGDYSKPSDIANLWQKDPELGIVPVVSAIKRWGQSIVAQEGESNNTETRFLFVIDQLEELFQWPEEEQLTFFSLMGAFARSGRIWVVVTMRSDFYTQLLAFPELIALKKDNRQYDMAPPNQAELCEIISGPATAAGLSFEISEMGESVADILQKEAENSPAVLPLLEFTLEQLYTERDREKKLLTFDSYNRLGGIKGALTKTAEEVFQSCSRHFRKAPDQVFAQVMRELVAIDEEGKATRRVASLSRFEESSDETLLIRRLIEMHLLKSYTDSKNEGHAVVDITHEALITHWKRVINWLISDKELLQVRDRIQIDQQRWRNAHKNRELLSTSGKRLEDMLYLDKSGLYLDQELKQYVDASKKRAKKLKRRKQLLFTLVGIICFLAAGFGFLTLISMDKLEISIDRSMSLQAKFQEASLKSKKLISESNFKNGNALFNGGEYNSAVIAYVKAMNQATGDSDDLSQQNEWISKELQSIQLSQLIKQESNLLISGSEIKVVSHSGSNLAAFIDKETDNSQEVIKVFNLENNRLIMEEKISQVGDVAFSPSGRYIAVEILREGKINTYDLNNPENSPKFIDGFKLYTPPIDFQFLNDHELLVKHGEILKIWHTFKSSPFSELKTLIKNASEFSILNETTLLTNNNKLWRLNENNCVLINSLEKTSHQTSRVTANQEFAYIPTYQEKIPRLQPVLEKFWQLRFFITADRKVRPLIHHVDLKSHGLKTTLLDIPELPMEYTDIDVLMPVKGILSRTGDIFYIFCESFFLDSFNLLPSGDRIDMLLTYDTKTNKPLGPAITLKKTAPNCFYYPIDTIGDFIILDYVNNSTTFFLPGENPSYLGLSIGRFKKTRDYYLLVEKKSISVLSRESLKNILEKTKNTHNKQVDQLDLFYTEKKESMPMVSYLPLTREENSRSVFINKRQRRLEKKAKKMNLSFPDKVIQNSKIVHKVNFSKNQKIFGSASGEKIFITGNHITELDCGGLVSNFFFMNQELVSISQESNIIVWDWESSSRVFQETFDGDLLISVSNGKLMAAATDSNEIIKLMKINSTWTTKKIKTEHKIYTLAVTDQYLITGDQSGHVNIYNSHLKLIKRLSVPDHRTVSHIALTEDSRYLVIGTTKGSIHFYIKKEYFDYQKSIHMDGLLHWLILSKNSETLITISREGTINTWDLRHNHQIIENLKLKKPVINVKFSNDHRWIIVAGLDNYVRLYDVETGKETLKIFYGQSSAILDAVLSPDNWYLLIMDTLGNQKSFEVGNQLFGKREADLFRVIANLVLFREGIIESTPKGTEQLLNYYTQPDPDDNNFWTQWTNQVLSNWNNGSNKSGDFSQ